MSGARRAGMTILEVVIASMVLAVIAIPLIEVFQGGMRATRATVQEILGANLAAELAEQIEIVPYEVLRAEVKGSDRFYSSQAGTLENRAPIAETRNWFFRVSPLPAGFHRSLSLRPSPPEALLAEVRVGWSVGGKRDRDIVIRRMIVRDTILPE